MNYFKHKSLTRVIIVFILLTTSTLGCIGGYWYFVANLSSPTDWKPLGHPSTKIDKLLAAKLYTVYAKTINGKIYSCSRLSQYDVECWVEVTQVPEITQSNCNIPSEFWTPELPGRVIDSLEFEYCHRFGRAQFKYILLEDGNVFQWGIDDFTWTPPPNLFGKLVQNVCGGCLIGLVGGASLIFVIQQRTHKLNNSKLPS
jgi:hypothetical protein